MSSFLGAGAAGAAGSNTLGMSNLGNTSGTTGVISGSAVRFLLAGGNNITLSQSVDAANVSATITISAANTGSTLSWFNYPDVVPGMVTTSLQGSTQYVQPFVLPDACSISYLRFPMSCSAVSTSYATSTAATSYSASILSTVWAVVYSLGAGANSRSLTSVASGSAGLSQQWSIAETGSQYTVSFNITFPSEGAGNSTFSTSQALSTAVVQLNTGSLTAFTGGRYLDIPFANSLAPNAYWIAVGISSTTSTQGIANMTGLKLSVSNLIVTQANTAFNIWGSATNSSNQLLLGLGSMNPSAINTTAAFDLSLVSSGASHPMLPFQGIREA